MSDDKRSRFDAIVEELLGPEPEKQEKKPRRKRQDPDAPKPKLRVDRTEPYAVIAGEMVALIETDVVVKIDSFDRDRNVQFGMLDEMRAKPRTEVKLAFAGTWKMEELQDLVLVLPQAQGSKEPIVMRLQVVRTNWTWTGKYDFTEVEAVSY